jgi:hypothetical protein
VAALVGAHITVTALTWRDLQSRTEDQVRGPKRLWQFLSALQMGNSLAYWVFARKSGPALHFVEGS